jgi:hypothetical protein
VKQFGCDIDEQNETSENGKGIPHIEGERPDVATVSREIQSQLSRTQVLGHESQGNGSQDGVEYVFALQFSAALAGVSAASLHALPLTAIGALQAQYKSDIESH